MERQTIDDLTPEEMEEYQELMEEEAEDQAENSMQLSEEMQDAYWSANPEEKMNAHSFLHKATFGHGVDTTKTTFLHEGELGRPLFTVRFMLDMQDVASFYLDPILKGIKLNSKDNRIAGYFGEKIKNVTDSGMSNKGFAMNLNVTQKRDMSKAKVQQSSIDNLKSGGIKK